MAQDNAEPRKGTAGQRKAAARQRRERQKRQQTYVIAGVMVVVVALVIVFIAYSSRPVEITMPADLAQFEGVEAGVTDAGFFRLGSADAPVVMDDFSNFTCSHCADFHGSTLRRLIDGQIAEGTLSVVFYPVVTGEQQSLLGAQAAVCAGQQDPKLFWEMGDVLFMWLRTANYPYYQGHVEEAARRLGLDMGAFGSCMGAQETMDLLRAAADEATLREVAGTPAFFFNGARPVCGGADPKCEGNLPYELVVQNIDRHLAGR
ncbi:MAG: hypothetical protein Kow00120_29560 [Anaerolineae bacterium]